MSAPRRAARRLALRWGAAGLVLAVSGCGGSGASAPVAVPTTAPVVTAAPLPTCTPDPVGAGFAWPAPVPKDLPVPPGGTLGRTRTTADGLTVVEFRTTTSLRDGVVFLVDNLAQTGYTLGRGDAEATEADAPFAKADLRGVFRMISRESCSTDWLLAITRQTVGGAAGGGSPLLPARPGAGSPSPLPFG